MLESPSKIDTLLHRYRTSQSCYDELLDSSGEMREHWQFLIQSLESMGISELQQRSSEVQRLLQENGVSYNQLDDPAGHERIWPLDFIPFLLTSQEWSKIERGVIQRAELFSLLLKDLYGDRTVLREGILPPEIVLSHPAYFRNLVRNTGFPEFSLDTYSVDVARRLDGEFIAIDDRSEFHLGSGYVLENRILISRVFPSLFRESNIHRLASFFRTFRATLADGASTDGGMPRIVLLTPGPRADGFFEHAYLSSYLGLTLAQASDLVVREGILWLRTLEGFRRVDALLRRVTDPFSDPLELRGDSFIGIPGLLEAVRLGNVRVMNLPGAGVIQNPALKYFLPALARHFLGEDLIMPSVIVQWCGDPKAMSYVEENLERMIIRPLYPSIRTSVVYDDLDIKQKEEILREIRQNPHLYVGQERIYPSTAPVWTGKGLEGRHLILRSYLVAMGDSYTVMPGGLARVSPFGRPLVYTNQKGGAIKDVWITASEPVKEITLLAGERGRLTISREGGEVAGRVADNMFWMGRYAERIEFTARLIRECLSAFSSGEEEGETVNAAGTMRSLRNQVGRKPDPDLFETNHSPEQELLELIYDSQTIGSLRYNASALDRASRSTPDRVSEDMRRMIRGMLTAVEYPRSLETSHEVVDQVIVYASAFSGLIEESMSRGQGWRFLEVGRKLERAVQTSTFLHYIFATEDSPDSEMALRTCDSERTYRRRYLSDMRPNAIFDILTLDESNPRSVIYQTLRLEDEIRYFHGIGGPYRNPEERAVLQLSTLMRLTDLQDSFLEDRGGRERRHIFFKEVLKFLEEIGDGLHERYFREVQKNEWRLLDGSFSHHS